jgi:ribosomal protein S18 acetylase RimI-like enzyme
MSVEIRPCTIGDESALSLVGQSTFLETFAGVLTGADIAAHCARQHSVDVYRQWLADGQIHGWIAQAQPGGAPVGYLLLTPPDLPTVEVGSDDLEVKRIYLLSRFHGRGLGWRLMNEAIQHARQIGCRRLLLGVYQHNGRALAFYCSLGFVQVGTRRFTVGSTECDDLILALHL